MVRPPSERALPATLWPPQRTEGCSPCSRATFTAATTSAVLVHRRIRPGCLSTMAFHTTRAAGYSGWSGPMMVPSNRPLRSLAMRVLRLSSRPARSVVEVMSLRLRCRTDASGPASVSDRGTGLRAAGLAQTVCSIDSNCIQFRSEVNTLPAGPRNLRPLRRVGAGMTSVGFIGSGHIGGTVARLSVAAGYDVLLSNSRDPQTLAGLVQELGPLARAVTSEEAAGEGDLVVVSVPLHAYQSVPAGPLAGKLVLDTCNYYPGRDGQIAELDGGSLTSSELVQRHLAGAHVVKAFNNIFYKH